MNKRDMELLTDICEALEALKEWKPLYLQVLKQTGSKRDAINAIKWVIEIEKVIGNAELKE